jgi:hypothetical protein
VSPGNARGNLLVVFATWNTGLGNTSGNPLLPALAVADDQGNWWRQVADSGPGTTTCATRSAVWVCSNALPVQDWLSVCPQGNYITMYVIVAEFSGTPASYWPVVDFTASNVAGWSSSSGQSQAGTLSQADYLLSFIGISTAALPSITTPGAGWTTITTESVHGPGYYPYYLTASASFGAFSSGTETASYTYSDASGAQCLIGISQESYLPVQQNADFPLVIVESAFGATIGDPTAGLLDTSWTDMSTYALAPDGNASITATRGRQYELATPESGVLTIMLNNLDGVFNPANAGSPFYSNAINSNMSFQSGIGGWVKAGNASISWSSAESFASSSVVQPQYSMLITPDGVTSEPGANASVSAAVNVNNQYTISAWYNCPAGYATGAQTKVDWYDGGTYLSTSFSTATAVPAGEWTQVSATVTPHSTATNAVLRVSFSGTPTTAEYFYVAEAMIAEGTTTSTGLVRQGTPVRVSCFWNGRRYPVAWGLVERWPQDWPLFPQWTWSEMTATDIAGAASVNLPSAVQGEILTCVPYACFPFSEQYSTSSNTINGPVVSSSECDGQIAVNTAQGNQRPAVYIDGNEPVETGSSMNFLGDSGTGMGVSSYQAFDTSGERGPGAQYGPDYNMPAFSTPNYGMAVPEVDFTFEVWWVIPDFTLPASTAVNVQHWSVMVYPDLYSNGTVNLAQGVLMRGGMHYPTSGTPAPYIQTNWNSTPVVFGSGFAAGDLVYNSIGLTQGIAYWCMNGQFTNTSVTEGPSVPPSNLYALTFGLSTGVTGAGAANDANFNYSLAYAALYPYFLPDTNSILHYQAGSTGFTGDTVLQRAARYVAWGLVNVGLAGPVVSEVPVLGPAYNTAGTQMSSALNSDAESAGSRWGGIANGNLVVVPRTASYDQPASVVFGNNPAGPLNANSNITAGTTGWTAVGSASLSATAGSLANAVTVLVITPNGSSANPGVNASSASNTSTPYLPVTANSEYIGVCLVMSPQGWASGATLTLDWYTSGLSSISTSTSATMQLTAGAWTYAEVVATAPGNAAYVIASMQATGTPPSTTVFQLAAMSVQLVLDQVPYEPNAGFDYDNTYVQNSAIATLTSGPSTLAAPLVRDQQSVVEYLQRGPLQQSVSGQYTEDAYDRATWSLYKYRQPSMRVRTLTVQPNSYPQAFTSILTTDIGDIGSVSRSPVPGPGYTLPVTVEQVSIAIGPGAWQVTYQQSPYVPDDAVLKADVAGYNVLGSNTLAW